MVNYCETHRWAWPDVDGMNPKGNCPGAGAGNGSSCRVHSTDAIGKINDLGRELDGAEETENFGAVAEPESEG